MATSFVNRIAVHLTPETACPTIPAAGSNIASLAGWVVLGSIKSGADANLAGEDVEVSYFDEEGQIMPPRNLTRDEIVTFQNGVDEITFTMYDGSEAALSIGSNISISSNAGEPTATTTYRTVLIEVDGVWLDYCPKCKISFPSQTAGYVGDPGQTEVIIRPCATTSYPAGIRRYWYQ